VGNKEKLTRVRFATRCCGAPLLPALVPIPADCAAAFDYALWVCLRCQRWAPELALRVVEREETAHGSDPPSQVRATAPARRRRAR